MAYKTTQKHFDFFVVQCKTCITLFGLKDWGISFAHESLGEGFLALCRFNNQDAHLARIFFAKEWLDQPTYRAISRIAYHEVCHILLADAYNVACCDDLSLEQTVSATLRAHHAIIRRLENAYMGGE